MISLKDYIGTHISKGFTEVDIMDYMKDFMKAILLSNTIEKAVSEREDVSDADKKAAVKEYGDVSYADEKNKKYPIDAKHIHAAISYFSKPSNYGQYDGESRKTIARKILSAAKKLGVDMDEDKWKSKFSL